MCKEKLWKQGNRRIAYAFRMIREKKYKREVNDKWEAFLELHQEKTVHWNCFME